MQITRLFQMVYLLLEQESLTAAQLADRLEVSPRTILRDVDVLSAAGIPIYCAKGKGGGIRLMPGFTLSRSMLSQAEQRDVLAALQGLSATGEAGAGEALQKLGAIFRQNTASWVAVDFSDWGRASAAQFDTLKAAVLDKQVIAFDYYASNGLRSQRTAEPLQLWFKHRAWYLRAWCRDSQAPRLFKLSRIHGLALTGEGFDRVFNADDFKDKAPHSPPPMPVIDVVLEIRQSAAYRVYDEFPLANITPLPGGGFRVKAQYIYEEWVLGYILSFGPAATVISPGFLREEIAGRLKKTLENYD